MNLIYCVVLAKNLKFTLRNLIRLIPCSTTEYERGFRTVSGIIADFQKSLDDKTCVKFIVY